jgi:glycerate 2-kinase
VKPLSRLRKDAARIWSVALRAVDPETAVRDHLRIKGGALLLGPRSITPDPRKSIWVIGVGKASAPMALAAERILGRRLAGGLIVTKYGHGLPLKKIETLESGHPLPDANGLNAGERIRNFAGEKVQSGDLVLCLLSGGGSALLPAPAPGITLDDKLACTRLLLRAGATIHEMNAIRKHLSTLKGGGMARLFSGARVVSLILSDVVGDSLDTIASGPLVPDSTTFAGCLDVLKRLNCLDAVPAPVRKRLEDGAAGFIPETPKPGDPVFRQKEHLIVGSNSQACRAAAAAARALGYRSLVLSTRLEGDTREAAGFHMSIAEEMDAGGMPVRRPACILTGGETTVKLTGHGKGGRNQEFVLHCVARLAAIKAHCAVVSIGTDGTDGPTDAAGAVADNLTLERSIAIGPRFLADTMEQNNSYEFFDVLGDLIRTGPTRTNVMDLRMILMG